MSSKLKDRPARTYTTGPVTRGLRYVAPVGVGVLSLYVVFTQDGLPDIVPTHFGFTGEADDWGPKWTVWVLLGVNILLVGLITWLSTRPRWFNYVSEITEDNAQHLYREGERMFVWMNVALMVVSYGVILSIYEIDSPLLVLGMIALPAITISSLIRMSLAADKKPANDGGLESTIQNLNW